MTFSGSKRLKHIIFLKNSIENIVFGGTRKNELEGREKYSQNIFKGFGKIENLIMKL